MKKQCEGERSIEPPLRIGSHDEVPERDCWEMQSKMERKRRLGMVMKQHERKRKGDGGNGRVATADLTVVADLRWATRRIDGVSAARYRNVAARDRSGSRAGWIDDGRWSSSR